MEVTAVLVVALKMVYGFDDKKEKKIVDKNLISNIKERIKEVEEKENEDDDDSISSNSIISDLKTLLFNLELIQNLPSKHHLL